MRRGRIRAMHRCALLLLGLAALGCSSYQLGHCRQPVESSSRSRVVVDGVHADVEQRPRTLVVHAVHLCNVAEHEEREAGLVAERLLPSVREDALKKEGERDASRMGPITTSMLRGDDDGLQHRTITTELVRSVSSPWIVAAAGGGVLETFLSARTRVDAKLDGERHERSHVRKGVPCPEFPYEGASVVLAVDEALVPIGSTDARGDLVFDLGELTAYADPIAEVMVEDTTVAAVDLAGPR